MASLGIDGMNVAAGLVYLFVDQACGADAISYTGHLKVKVANRRVDKVARRSSRISAAPSSPIPATRPPRSPESFHQLGYQGQLIMVDERSRGEELFSSDCHYSNLFVFTSCRIE